MCGVVVRGRDDPTSAANGVPPQEAIVGPYQELGCRIYSHRVIVVGQHERPITRDSCGDVSHVGDGQMSVHHVRVNLVDNPLYGSKPAQAERGVRHGRKSGKRENPRAGLVEHARTGYDCRVDSCVVQADCDSVRVLLKSSHAGIVRRSD